MATARDPFASLELARGAYMDARLNAFETHLHRIVLTVNGKIAGYLQKSLSITNGVIDSSASNLRVLRTLNNKIEAEMDRAGFPSLVNAFVGEFPGQLQFIQEELKTLDVILPGVLPTIRLTAEQFASFQLNAVSSIETVIEQAAAGAMNRVAFVSQGLKFGSLIDTIGQKFQAAIPQTVSIADTVFASYYRVALDRTYQLIQRATPDMDQEFRYFGPLDVKTRALCIRLLEAPNPFTRREIDNIEVPGFPLGSCWNVCGGVNCRHRYRLVFSATQLKAAA